MRNLPEKKNREERPDIAILPYAAVHPISGDIAPGIAPIKVDIELTRFIGV